jgi:hypothetical protein
MPLGARRLLLVADLCIPLGLLGGSYLPGLQLRAVAGVGLITVALSYRARGTWFWPLSWVTAGGTDLWLTFTAAYLMTVIVAADARGRFQGRRCVQ